MFSHQLRAFAVLTGALLQEGAVRAANPYTTPNPTYAPAVPMPASIFPQVSYYMPVVQLVQPQQAVAAPMSMPWPAPHAGEGQHEEVRASPSREVGGDVAGSGGEKKSAEDERFSDVACSDKTHAEQRPRRADKFDSPTPETETASGHRLIHLSQHLDSQPLLSTQAPPTSSPPVSPSGRHVRSYEEIEVLSRDRDPEKLYSARISLRQAIRALVVSEKTVEQLVEFVKLCQKLDAEIRTAWIHYTTAEARGVRDPSKQEEKLLRRFFSGLQDGSMEEYRRMRNPHRGETANEVFVGGIGVIAVPVVEAYFKRFGPLRYVDVRRDKGFGFVKFESKDIMMAVLAVEQHIIEGKRVEVKPAENRAPQNKKISQKWSLAPREETKIVEVGSGGQSPSLLSVRKLRAELADAEAGGELSMLLPPAASFPQDGRAFSSGKKGGAGKYNQHGAATTNKGGKGWKQGEKGFGGAAAGKGRDKGQQHQGKKDYYSKEKYPVGSHFEHLHARGGGKLSAKGQPLERSAKGGGRGNDYSFGASDDYTYPAQTANYGSGCSYNSKSDGFFRPTSC